MAILIISKSSHSNLFFEYFTVIHVIAVIGHSGGKKAQLKHCVCPKMVR